MDAAKTNRAVSVYRSITSDCDLKILADSCLQMSVSDPGVEFIDHFINIYQDMMGRKKYARMFGLRDVIHFFTYLNKHSITPVTVTKAVERNFNGTEHTNTIANAFLKKVSHGINALQIE